jgi:hypothetical protein
MKSFGFSRLLLVCSTLASVGLAAGPKTGFRYNGSGALEEVRDVTSDVANCGTIGAACGAGQICCFGNCCTGTCNSDQCCGIPVCPAWGTCGVASLPCGNTTSCGTCGSGQRCAMSTNQCFEDRRSGYVVKNENATNDLVVVAGSAFDMEVTGQFVSSKGAHATAMGLVPVSPSASCNINGGFPGCPQYTLECASCPPDPNAGPHELSCSCNRGSSLTYSLIPKGTEQSFSSQLLIDKDRDRQRDSVRRSSSGAGSVDR